MKKALFGFVLALTPFFTLNAAHAQASPQELYEAKCGACHSPASNRVGPLHNDVVGRKAGIVAGYSYSAALKKSNIVWTEANLDKWLAGPAKMVPGSKMFFTINDPKVRADIISYLKTLKTPGAASQTPAQKPKK